VKVQILSGKEKVWYFGFRGNEGFDRVVEIFGNSV
jgi:hypothetical protein